MTEENKENTENTENTVMISQEDLKNLLAIKERANQLTQRAQMAALEAKMAALEAKNAELEFNVSLRTIYIKYGLSLDDNFNIETGIVTKNKKED